VIPEFYTSDEQGIPTAWVARMRESMARLTPHFSTNRAVCEYTEHHNLLAALSTTGLAFAYKLVIVVEILVRCLTPRPGS
jgi:hypothetical protein